MRVISFGGLSRAFLTVVPVAYLGVVGAMYTMQDKLTFDADRRKVPPEEVGIGNAEPVTITTADGERLNAWYTPAQPGQPTILFLHGKGGNISHRPNRYRSYTGEGFGVLFLDYRGYGGSTGTPSEAGLITDAEAAHDWLQAQGVAPASLVVIGESLGTGIAVKLAARRPVAALALEAPYSSLADVAASHYWWLPVRPLIRNVIDAEAVIGDVKAPLLIHHGDADRTVPIVFGQKLYAAANEPKEFVTVAGAGHFIFTEKTFAREAEFIRAHVAVP